MVEQLKLFSVRPEQLETAIEKRERLRGLLAQSNPQPADGDFWSSFGEQQAEYNYPDLDETYDNTDEDDEDINEFMNVGPPRTSSYRRPSSNWSKPKPKPKPKFDGLVFWK